MTGQRKSARMREQILKLYAQGVGKKKIALALRISKNTVRGVLRAPAEKSPSDVAALSDWRDAIDWEVVKDELSSRYATIKQLAKEFAPEASYFAFRRALLSRTTMSAEQRARIRFHHEPGSRLEIDYCDGIPIYNRETGEILHKTHLFLAVSAFSDYTFGEFVRTQKQKEFLASQDRMFAFFGGVFEYVVVDNLKSGVTKSHRYDPDANATYVDYANHMGFAVLPARPKTPRDKPSIEGGIGVVQRQFYAEVRNRKFYSLAELNAVFRVYLPGLNQGEMKDYGVSRVEKFTVEKEKLKALPVAPYELNEFKKAKVHPDCHIQVDKNYYSVPYRFIGQTVTAKLSQSLVEVFDEEHTSIAVHCRQRGRGQFTTLDAHYPEQKIITARMDLLTLKEEARRIGPKTEAFVNELFSRPAPLRYLRRVQGLVRLKKALPLEAIEHACAQGMLFNRYRLKYVADCAKQFSASDGRIKVLPPVREKNEIHLHCP